MDGKAIRNVADLSGLVVHARPGRATQVAATLECIGGVTLHAASPEGKLIVTLETASEADSAALFDCIQRLDGVAAVAMAYHQIENDPDEEL